MVNPARLKPSFNPFAWGTLFFTSWLTLITIPGIGNNQNIIAWIFFGLSCILWLAVFLPALDRPMGTPVVKQTILPLVFLLTPYGLIMGSIKALPEVPHSYQIIVPVGTLVWLFAYMSIFIWSVKPTWLGTLAGIGASVFFIITGVIYLFQATPPTHPLYLIALGLALIMVTIFKSKVGREFPF